MVEEPIGVDFLSLEKWNEFKGFLTQSKQWMKSGNLKTHLNLQFPLINDGCN